MKSSTLLMILEFFYRISLNSTYFYYGEKERVYNFLETLDVPPNPFTVVLTVCHRYSRNTVLSLRYILCWTCAKGFVCGVFFSSSYSWVAVSVYIPSAITVLVNVTVTL